MKILIKMAIANLLAIAILHYNRYYQSNGNNHFNVAITCQLAIIS